MISCEKATKICNKAQYNEATLWERLLLVWHTIVCKVCAQFSKDNKKLTSLCNEAKLQALPAEKKQQIREKVEHELSK